jgi:selenocysteine lyase/cysteine desulfurase
MILQIGIKYGHFYATRIFPLLPIEQECGPIPARVQSGAGSAPWKPTPDEDAVVRISLVHYNTVEQVDRIVAALRKAVMSRQPSHSA